MRRLAVVAGLLLVVAWTAPAAAGPGRAAFLAPLEVDGPVDGDVVAIGGDVILGPHARVGGHAVAVFGQVVLAPGARVEGRALSVVSLSSLTLVDEGSRSPASVSLGVPLLACGGWLLVTTLAALLAPAWMRRGAATVQRLGPRVVVMGLLVVVTLFTALVAVLGLGGPVGVGLAALLWLLFLVAKAIGLTLIGAILGGRIVPRLLHRPTPLSLDVFVGVGLLLAVRFLPIVGGSVWSVLAVVALGAGVLAAVLVPAGGTIAAAPVHN